MPDNTADRDAIIAFAKSVRDAQARTGGSAETPDARTQRYLEKSQTLPRAPEFETPDQRTQRFLDKSKASRSTVFHDTDPDQEGNKSGPWQGGPQSAQDDPGEDFEVGPDGTLVPTAKRPQAPAWYAGGGGEREMGQLAESVPKLSPEHKAQLEQAMFNLRQAGQKIDLGIQRTRLEAAQQKTPEAKVVNLAINNPWMKAAKYLVEDQPAAARNPVPRDITSFERDDSEDMPVSKYSKEDIDRVKKAIQTAKGAK